MKNKLSNEVLIDLYNKNYTLKEIALLYDLNPSTIHRRVNNLLENGALERRPRLRKNRATIYGNDDRINISIKLESGVRVITDEDIMTIAGFGFSPSRISIITGISIDMIRDIIKKYKDLKIRQNPIDKFYVIELYNNKFNMKQIAEITGYDRDVISAIIHQADRHGFINRAVTYVATAKEKVIMDMYRDYVSIEKIARTVSLSKEDTKEIIYRLISTKILQERNNASKILNKKRINLGIEDDNILRMYNLCISEDIISRYYKTNKNTILKVLSRIGKEKIKIYDKISDLLKERKTISQISILLDVPTSVLYEHLREVIR